MKFGKFVFENMSEFQNVKNEAKENGVITVEDFFNFLRQNYSHKIK